jgi:hypothetical protein
LSGGLQQVTGLKHAVVVDRPDNHPNIHPSKKPALSHSQSFVINKYIFKRHNLAKAERKLKQNHWNENG